MSLGKLEILERPKSKWPYWVLFNFEDPLWPHIENMYHIYRKLDFLRDKIPVVIQRQWAWAYNFSEQKIPKKTQSGILYKFLNEGDRLIFLMQRETGQ